MAKIAVTTSGTTAKHGNHNNVPVRRVLAEGKGWNTAEVICRAGPWDRPFEERHSQMSIAIIAQGSFQYRSDKGRELMTPGSLLLGNAGQYFECGHDHAFGDRCISSSYEPEFFDSLVAETEITHSKFSRLRVPLIRELSSLVSRAVAGVREIREDEAHTHVGRRWEEIAIELAARALDAANVSASKKGPPPSAEARITRVIRCIEAHPDWNHELASLAFEAQLSRFHFLRTFQELTGLTPHRYVLRTRLRNAAMRLVEDPAPVLEVALDAGFGDVSNFNHSFRNEFGMSPRSYRKLHGRR